jgi:hypothetical protein
MPPTQIDPAESEYPLRSSKFDLPTGPRPPTSLSVAANDSAALTATRANGPVKPNNGQITRYPGRSRRDESGHLWVCSQTPPGRRVMPLPVPGRTGSSSSNSRTSTWTQRHDGNLVGGPSIHGSACPPPKSTLLNPNIHSDQADSAYRRSSVLKSEPSRTAAAAAARLGH